MKSRFAKYLFLIWALSFGQVSFGNDEKSFNLALPLVALGGESVLRAEYNMGQPGSLGLEFTLIQESELLSQREIEEQPGDSLLQAGSELSLIYSSYVDKQLMSGFFWALGIGYRAMRLQWKRTPSLAFAPTGMALDEQGRFQHSLRSVGVTGRARFGYRYVASSIPFSIGAYLGIRHFQNRFEDIEGEEDDAVVTPEDDKQALQRRLTSSLEPGLEVGLAF